MAKIRALKPEFFTDERVVELSPMARLLYQGLWVHACDNGHIEDRPRQLKMRIFPADDCSINDLLAEIEKQGMIERRNGWIFVLRFADHQKPDRRYWLTCDLPGCERPPADHGSGQRFGNHQRWHVNRAVVDPECEFCPREPADTEPPPRRGHDEPTTSTPRGNDEHPTSTPEQNPLSQPHDVDPSCARSGLFPDGDCDGDGDGDGDRKNIMSPLRADAESMLDYLDARIEAIGVRTPPRRTKANRDAARLMLDRDRYDPREIREVIDWATASTFWAPNIGSAAKLREQYQTLRGQMRRPTGPRPATKQERNLAILDRAAERERQAFTAPAQKEIR